MEDVMFGDDWYEDLPSPDMLEWEDVEEQVEEEVMDSSDNGEDDEPMGIVLTHISSGVSAAADEYRTREENRELARDRLLDRIIERMEEIEEEEQAYPESEQIEGFDEDRAGPEDRWTPADPDDPPWDEQNDQSELP